MILLMFGLAVLFGAIFLYLGYGGNSFGFAYLGMFVFFVLGMFLFAEGLSIESGMQELPINSHNFVTTYDIHTTLNDQIVNILANTFFYIPIAGFLLTTFIALRR